MTHTPGPWLIDDSVVGGLPHKLILDSRPADQGDPEAGGPIIAELWHAEQPTLDADARLIAAAPDLLAALQDAVETRWEGPDDEPHWLEPARAAIAKATA